MPSLSDGRLPLRASGGVVWRRRRDHIEVLLVHRPNRRDWSLPKGKPEPGENPLQTAVREVTEETGLPFTLGPFLTQVRYPRLDTEKRVDYWSMRLDQNSDGTPAPMDADEIDGFQWMGLTAAEERLTYPIDTQVLRKFSAHGTVDISMLLVRHGSAGDRRSWSGNDDRRPLDRLGKAQAEAIAHTLGAFGPSSLYAARPFRCIQTLQPLAKRLALNVGETPELSEREFSASSAEGMQTLQALLEAPGTAVVCSQGGVIPTAVDQLVPHRRGRKSKSRKGSVWALGVQNGKVSTVDHYASLLKRA